MRSMNSAVILLAATLLVPGEALARWFMVPENNPRYASPRGDYAVTLPPGWMLDLEHRRMVVTRDGQQIHFMVFQRDRLKDAFDAIDREASPDLLPGELSELAMTDVRKRLGNENIEVISDEPVEFGDHLGFRVEYRWKDDRGLRWGGVRYGFATEDGYHLLAYHGPILRYFEEELEMFEDAVSSFRID